MGQKGQLNPFQEQMIGNLANIGQTQADSTNPIQFNLGDIFNAAIGGNVTGELELQRAQADANRQIEEALRDVPAHMQDQVRRQLESQVGEVLGQERFAQREEFANTLQQGGGGPFFNFEGIRQGVGQELPQAQQFNPFGGKAGGGQQVNPNPGGALTGGRTVQGSGGITSGRRPTRELTVQQPQGGGGGLPSVGDLSGQLPGPFNRGADPLADATQNTALNALNNPVTAGDILNQQQGEIQARLNLNNEAAGAAGNFGGSSNLIQNAMDIGQFTSRAQDVANQQNQLAFGNALGRQQAGFGQDLAGFGAGLDRFGAALGAQGQGFNQAANIFDRNRGNQIQDFMLQENLANTRLQQQMLPLNLAMQFLGLGSGAGPLQGALQGFNQSAAQNAAMNPLNQLAGAAGGLGGQALSGKLGGTTR